MNHTNSCASLDKFFAKQPVLTVRHQVPPNEQEVSKPVMTQFFKSFVGRDVDSLNAIPVEFFEPLSNLQRFSECLEYSEVLDQAVQCPSSMDRLLQVAVFAIANYAHTAFRFREYRKHFANDSSLINLCGRQAIQCTPRRDVRVR
jgi:hypothetical protein